jgi:hypothetical protein
VTAGPQRAASFFGTPRPALLLRLALLLSLALALVLSLGAAPSADGQTIQSDLRVPPGGTFVLGGGDSGSFRVTATNVGRVAVTLGERRADGTEAYRALAPGARARVRFAAGSAALVVNCNSAEARLDARIVGGGEGMGMRYVPSGS